jgi:hypothetical protein
MALILLVRGTPWANGIMATTKTAARAVLVRIRAALKFGVGDGCVSQNYFGFLGRASHGGFTPRAQIPPNS